MIATPEVARNLARISGIRALAAKAKTPEIFAFPDVFVRKEPFGMATNVLITNSAEIVSSKLRFSTLF